MSSIQGRTLKMSGWPRAAAIALACIGLTTVSEATAGQAASKHSVHGTTVVSSRDPAVVITLPAKMRYVGTDRFILSKPTIGPFDACDLYAFADADAGGTLRKYYWVQFERYLPGHPQLHHNYDSPRHATIGNLDFYVDTEFSDGTGKPSSGSDSEHFYGLLAAHGYRRAPMMFVRFVHLPDASRRKELMIIVAESLPDGLKSADISPGGAAHSRWPRIEQDFIDRSAQSIKIDAASRSDDQ